MGRRKSMAHKIQELAQRKDSCGQKSFLFEVPEKMLWLGELFALANRNLTVAYLAEAKRKSF